MKSFRLDLDSVDELVRGWRYWLILFLVASVLVWLMRSYEWVRILFPVVFGVALAPCVLVQMKQKYPQAKHRWLLSTGMMTCLVGVVLRMAFPRWQGSAFDLTWLGVTFFSILGFVLGNRGEKDVVK